MWSNSGRRNPRRLNLLSIPAGPRGFLLIYEPRLVLRSIACPAGIGRRDAEAPAANSGQVTKWVSGREATRRCFLYKTRSSHWRSVSHRQGQRRARTCGRACAELCACSMDVKGVRRSVQNPLLTRVAQAGPAAADCCGKAKRLRYRGCAKVSGAEQELLEQSGQCQCSKRQPVRTTAICDAGRRCECSCCWREAVATPISCGHRQVGGKLVWA